MIQRIGFTQTRNPYNTLGVNNAKSKNISFQNNLSDLFVDAQRYFNMNSKGIADEFYNQGKSILYSLIDNHFVMEVFNLDRSLHSVVKTTKAGKVVEVASHDTVPDNILSFVPSESGQLKQILTPIEKK